MIFLPRPSYELTFTWIDLDLNMKWPWPLYELTIDLHMNSSMTFIWTHQWPSIELTNDLQLNWPWSLCHKWPTDLKKERKLMQNVYVWHWNILHKSKNIMFIFNGIITWHCGVITLHPAWQFAHAHYRNQFEFGLHYGSKKNDIAKKRTADARVKRFWVYRFWV